ncbi:MAG: helix-hairpin-helix domain-containing protein [Candidatus Pacebacteria bacterium]|nr:helix-hairpin-helix domain-containing protein [Candidatus Paceibacterota bacterium]
MNNKKNENINISKILAFSFVFIFLILPIKFSFAFSLPSHEANSIFIKLQEEIAGIHLEILDKSTSSSYSPEEEAVIVVTKNVINQKLVNLNFKQLPKEFLIKTLTEGGKKAFSVATNDSFDLITSEIVGRAVDEIIDILEDEEVYINSGEVEIGYRDINQNKRKEVLYYSIVMDKKTGETSISFYSKKEFFAPESKLRHVTSYLSPAKNTNTQWSVDEFKREKLRPFIVTFSGTIVEGSTGALKFSGDVGFNIEFMSQEEIEELRNVVMIQAPSLWEEAMGTAIDVGGFFVEKTGETADLVGDGWGKTKEIAIDAGGFLVEKTGETADLIGDRWDKTKTFAVGAFGGLSGATSYNKEQGVVIDLADINRNQNPVFNQEEDDDEQEVFGADDIEEKVDDKVDDEREDEEEKQDQEEIVVSVELNSAIGEDLELLSGIGPVYAERIIGNRPFCSLDDLTKVPGIGEATLRNIREQGLAYVNPVSSCFQEEEVEEEEEVDEETLEKFEEIKRRIEELREKVNKKEESGEEEEEEQEQEQEEVTSVEINSASEEELDLLTGVGPAYAERIIENRPFCSLDDLERVSGIGEKTIENIKDQGLAYVDAPDSCFEDDDEDSGGGGGGGSSPPPDDSDDEEDEEDDSDEDEEDTDEEDEEEGDNEDDNEEGEEDDEEEIILTHLSEVKHGEGEEVEVKVEISNFEDALYDIKVAIEADEDLHFSEIYNEGEWKSAFNYIEEAIQGPSEEKTFRLRIKEEKNYDGAGKIVAKIRKDGSIIKEGESLIEILKKEEKSGDDEGSNNDDDEKEVDIGEDFRIVYSGDENLYRVDIDKEESSETNDVVLDGSSNFLFDNIEDGSKYITDDGEYFYLGDQYGALYKVRMATGKRMWDYEVDSGSVSKIETWEDYVIVSSTKGAVYKINKETGESEVLWNGGSRIYDMEIYDNNLYLGLSSNYDNNFKEIDLNSRSVLREINCGGAGSSAVTVTNNDNYFYVGSNSSGSSIVYSLNFDDFSCEAIYYVNIVTRSGGEYINQMEVEEDYLYIAKRGASGYSGSVSRVFLETNESDWSYNPEGEIDFESLVILGDYTHALDSEHDKVHWIDKKTGEGDVLTEDSAINNLHLTEEDLIQQKTVPTINLAVDEYDLYNPSDVVVDIIWNDAEQEAEVVYSNEVVLEEDNDYLVEANQLTIYQSFFDDKEPEEGDIFNFEIFFDIEEIIFEVEIIDTTPEEEESGDDSDEEEVTSVEINSASKEHLELLDGVGEEHY